MLSPICPALAPVALPPPVPANPRGAAGASGDAAPHDFAQALDEAVTAEPKAAPNGRSRGLARQLAAGKQAGEAGKGQHAVKLAALPERADGKTDLQLPLQVEGESELALPLQPEGKTDLQLPPQPEGRTDLPLPSQLEGRTDLQLPPQLQGKTDLQLPPQLEGKADLQYPPQVDGKTDLQLPPQVEGEGARASRLAAPSAVGALLAQLRATTPVAPSANAVDAAARLGEPKQTALTPPRPFDASESAAAQTGGPDAAATARRVSRRDESPSAGPGRDDSARCLPASAPQAAPATLGETPAVVVPAALLASAAAAPRLQAVQAEARLPASPGSAEFGPQLGAQISTFVRAGVQHALLHLSPAEMGPVVVQIQLHGQAALVHLSADHAHTREALEQAMPQLASSLRETGLTLTGGGVFQQPQQGRDQPAGGSATPGGSNPDQPAERRQRGDAAAAVQRHRGVVDLIA